MKDAVDRTYLEVYKECRETPESSGVSPLLEVGPKMTIGILSRAVDPIVFDNLFGKFLGRKTPQDKKCAIKKELFAAVLYIDRERRNKFLAHMEIVGSRKDKVRVRHLRFIVQKRGL